MEVVQLVALHLRMVVCDPDRAEQGRDCRLYGDPQIRELSVVVVLLHANA